MRNLYAVFDVKAKAYGPILEYKHDAVAVREFGAACEDSQSQLSKYPEDFELHNIGHFAPDDQETGDHPLCSREPVLVITATQYLQARHKPSQLELLKEAANG